MGNLTWQKQILSLHLLKKKKMNKKKLSKIKKFIKKQEQQQREKYKGMFDSKPKPNKSNKSKEKKKVSSQNISTSAKIQKRKKTERRQVKNTNTVITENNKAVESCVAVTKEPRNSGFLWYLLPKELFSNGKGSIYLHLPIFVVIGCGILLQTWSNRRVNKKN